MMAKEDGRHQQKPRRPLRQGMRRSVRLLGGFRHERVGGGPLDGFVHERVEVRDRLTALRGPTEDYSDVIVRLAKG